MTDESFLYCRRCGDPLVLEHDGQDKVRCSECETSYLLDLQEGE